MYESGPIKYEITDDLRLNAWGLDDDVAEVPPFWYQNTKPDGTPWANADEIHAHVADYVKDLVGQVEEL